MNIALLIVVGALSQGPKAAPYYDFKPGTTWKYTLQQGNKSVGSMHMRVTRRTSDGKHVYVTSQKFDAKGTKPEETAIWCVVRGLVTWSKHKDGEIVPQLHVYKPDARPGDTWPASGVKTTARWTARFIGIKTMTVPAGTFKNVKHIQIQPEGDGPKIVMHLFLVPKVGFIQYTVHAGTMGRIQARLKLKSYKIAK